MILVAVYGLSIFSAQYLLRKTAQTILHCAVDKNDKDARHPPCKREGCDDMFGKLKNMFGAKDAAVMILAPVEGEVVPVTQVSDPTFGEEILGKGVAIKPERGRVVAPVSGEISLMFDTGHAVSIVSDDGAEGSLYTYSLRWVVILIYLGSNSRSVSTVLYSFSIPVPFSGGRISKEKAVLSVLFIKSTTLIVLSRSLMPSRAELHIWAKIRKIS